MKMKKKDTPMYMKGGMMQKMPGGGMMQKMPGGGMMKKKNMPMYMYGGKVYAEKGAMLKAILKDPAQAKMARKELGMK
tara:strand:- start:843 stop:1076 length:234 start_codon:yes stop_codon:yes gene_type:complete